VAFFDLQVGVKLAIWPRSAIAQAAHLAPTAHSPTEFTLGYTVGSKADVDAVLARAARAGATILQPAAQTVWGGYAGYFQDPDEHVWEIAWNPQT